MTLPLPESFTIRPCRIQPGSHGNDDAEAVANLVNACAVERTGLPEVTAAGLRAEWQAPSVHLETDTALVHATDGSLAGYVTVWAPAPHVRLRAVVEVHPSYRGQGIGTALSHWLDDRGRQALTLAPEGIHPVLAQPVLSTDEASQALLRAEGYELARHEFHMLLEMDAPPDESAPPDEHASPGIRLRPFDREGELETVLQVIREAFRGHWGYVELDFDDDLKEYLHLLDTDPNIDPTLWFVAEALTDPARLVGTCFCYPVMAGDPDQAFIWGLAVLRPWRRQGVALALLQHAFGELYRRGKRRVSLRVDAGNADGATHLYEKAGMRVQRQYAYFEKTVHE
ncbi:MAG TPA: GNAT family N-acetyltransferase [Anaerolineae bacterium]|nr:GNAT family N-acetyltransferase [Anaerolineae bacterium]